MRKLDEQVFDVCWGYLLGACTRENDHPNIQMSYEKGRSVIECYRTFKSYPTSGISISDGLVGKIIIENNQLKFGSMPDKKLKSCLQRKFGS